jgi:hypothetical protein
VKHKRPSVTNLLNVPSPEADDRLVNLADWLEVKALLDTDGNASQEDLARALSRAYSMDGTAAKRLAGDVFKELQDRNDSCVPVPGKSDWEYPFTVSQTASLLSLRAKLGPTTKRGLLYTFLLVASRADMDVQRKLEGLDPTILFEQLCADILLNFWGGPSTLTGSLVFGTARTKDQTNQKFETNINNLCATLKEGRGLKDKAKAPGAGDGKLGVVVWRIFSDGPVRRAGRLRTMQDRHPLENAPHEAGPAQFRVDPAAHEAGRHRA